MQFRTMIHHLPSDLIEEILTWIPLKSMKKVQLTCKTWDTLSRSESFAKVHTGKAPSREEEESPMMLVLMDYNLYSVNLEFDPSTNPKGQLTCLNKQVKISKVYHCHGLLLCILKDDSRFLVWNPLCGQTRWIKPRYTHPYGWDIFSHALGYADNKSGRRPSVKFLRFIDYYFYIKPEKQFFCYEIYDFNSGLWTTLDVDTPHWCIMFASHGVSLKGNTYWCAKGRNSSNDDDSDIVDHIICFDFTKERFGPLMPLPFIAGCDDYAILSCVREDKLAVSLQHNEVNPYELEIWITTKIDAENVSWSKFLAMETVHPCLGSFFVDEEKKLAMGLNRNYRRTTFSIIGEDGYSYSIKLDLGKGNGDPNGGCSYVPSLVQIKKGALQVKRKGDDSLEKHRFDRKMARLASFEKQESDYYNFQFETCRVEESYNMEVEIG